MIFESRLAHSTEVTFRALERLHREVGQLVELQAIPVQYNSVDSFTMLTLSIHCIMKNYDLSGFLKHNLLNLY